MNYQTFAALLVLVHFGCNSNPSPTQRCTSLVAALCKKAFECNAGAAFASEPDCETQLSAKIGCASWTLPQGCTYDWSQFDACLSEVSAQSCSAAQSGQQPASCAGATTLQPTCTNPSGDIYCSDESGSSSNSGCRSTHSGCTDGNTYAIVCDSSGSCVCQVNGATTQPAARTDCTSDEATLNQLCGWQLHVFPNTRDMTVPPDLATPPDLSTGCTISGAFYTPGTVNPQNPCEMCDPVRYSSGWSPRDNVTCGNGCGKCAGGTCGSVPLTSVASGMAQQMVIDANYAYWTDSTRGTVSRVPLAGGATTQLATGVYQPVGIALDTSYVYWTAIGSGSVGIVQRAPLAGGTITTLGSAGRFPSFLAIDATSAYWTDGSAGTVQRVPIGGGTVTTLATGQSTPRGIAVDATNVYWANYGNGTVMKVAIGGGTPTAIASTQDMPYAVTLDSTYLYWNTYREVRRMPLAGGNITSLNAGELGIAEWGLALDGTSAYYTYSIMNGSVGKVPLAGGRLVTLVPGRTSLTPYAVAVDATCAYFTVNGNVERAPK